MRHIALVVGIAVAFAGACTHRVSSDDSGIGTDAYSAPNDAGIDAATPQDAFNPNDASGVDAPGLQPDAASYDTGLMHSDTNTGPCSSAIDVSAGGTFMVDTCASSDHFASTCGTTGTNDVILSATEMGLATQLSTTGASGWVFQQLTHTCAVNGGPTTCGTTGTWGQSGTDGFPRYYWGLERMDGTCGMVTVTVTRM